MVRSSLLLIVFALLYSEAVARIGENTEESIKRYGEEKTLAEAMKKTDIAELKLAEATKRFNDSSPNERIKTIAKISTDYDRFRSLKDKYNELKTKGVLEKKEFVDDKEIQKFLGERFVSFEGVGAVS